MAIKETPTNIRIYHKAFKDEYKEKLKTSKENRSRLEEEVKDIKDNISKIALDYKHKYDIDIYKYTEFVENRYISGLFYEATKRLLFKSNESNSLDLFLLHDLANKQKEIHKLSKVIRLANNCLSISFTQYRDILRTYYTEVHKHLILEGEGYAFTGDIGWVCINRWEPKNRRKILSYSLTKQREKELKEKGLKIYNKEEADWCLRNGIEYKAEDKRVFIKPEAVYQIPLLACHLPDAYDLEFVTSDYRHIDCRGKTNEDLIELCDRDLEKICKLEVDLKTKITLCNTVDKTLYTKFIRNESQNSINYRKVNR